MSRNCGVYQIRNLINGKLYIGQSINLEKRKKNHFLNLNKNKHDNIYLQRSFSKNGLENFIFEVLIFCEPFELTKYEQFFVDKYKDMGLLYNIRLECVDSNKGIHFSKEVCKKISEGQKNRPPVSKESRMKLSRAMTGKNNPWWGKFGENHPSYGLIRSEETNMKNGMCRILDKEICLKIIKMLNKNILVKEISDTLNISTFIIYNVKNGFYKKYYPDIEEVVSYAGYRTIKKEIVEKILNMLKSKMSVEDISVITKIPSHTVYRIRSGEYLKEYGIDSVEFEDAIYYGADHPGTIKKDVVIKVKRMFIEKKSIKDIARKCGICTKTVYNIINGYYDKIYGLSKMSFDDIDYGKRVSNETKRKMSEKRGVNKEKILLIKKLLNDGISKASIVKKINVSTNTIMRVKNGGYDEIFDLNSNDKNRED